MNAHSARPSAWSSRDHHPTRTAEAAFTEAIRGYFLVAAWTSLRTMSSVSVPYFCVYQS